MDEIRTVHLRFAEGASLPVAGDIHELCNGCSILIHRIIDSERHADGATVLKVEAERLPAPKPISKTDIENIILMQGYEPVFRVVNPLSVRVFARRGRQTKSIGLLSELIHMTETQVVARLKSAFLRKAK